MKFRPFTLPTSIALLACGLLGAPMAAASDCLIRVDSLDEPRNREHPPLLSLVTPKLIANAFEARCDERGLAELMVEIQPGQSMNVRLQIHHPNAASASLGSPPSGFAPWLLVDSQAESRDQYWRLDLQLDGGELTTPGQRMEQILGLSLMTDHGPIDWRLPIRLLVVEETSLFRNRFEVDPVLGQFSYLPSDQDFHSR